MKAKHEGMSKCQRQRAMKGKEQFVWWFLSELLILQISITFKKAYNMINTE